MGAPRAAVDHLHLPRPRSSSPPQPALISVLRIHSPTTLSAYSIAAATCCPSATPAPPPEATARTTPPCPAPTVLRERRRDHVHARLVQCQLVRLPRAGLEYSVLQIDPGWVSQRALPSATLRLLPSFGRVPAVPAGATGLPLHRRYFRRHSHVSAVTVLSTASDKFITASAASHGVQLDSRATALAEGRHQLGAT